MKYRKKPVVIDAVQYLANKNFLECVQFCPILKQKDEDSSLMEFVIPTLEGDMKVSYGDWIIKGVKGEFYPCKPDIFNATYEAVE